MALAPLAQRLLRHYPVTCSRELTIDLGGRRIVGRLDAGDIQSFREVLIEEVYRFPGEITPDTLLDIGANIGLTSLYYAEQYPLLAVVAVEPDPRNASLARRNLASVNAAEVVEAAVSSCAGEVAFASGPESTLGRVDPNGNMRVQAVTMGDLLDRLPGQRADLVKIDIEGGEGQLFSENCGWLDRVSSIIIELQHPTETDTARVVSTIEAAGFKYLSAGSVWEASMDAFVRVSKQSPAETLEI